jgi:predicted kinase
VERLTRLTLAELDRQTPCIVRRAAAGFARRCHGDLHLGNILLEDGRPVLFDCLEFNDVLSDVDVLYDLGFLLMDLDFRGRRDAAVRVLAAYVDEAARAFADDLWDGLEVLPLMLSVRATVRAHVSAHSGDAGTARAYVEAAIAHLTPAAPVLAVVGGVSGSGKTTFARAAAPHLGASPGAVILRTDEVRKRLLGVARTEPLPDEAYTPQADARTYAALFDAAGRLLRAGRGVVLDATFLDPDLRVRAEALATACGARFRPAWMAAPVEVLEARIADRRGDASDATAEVARRQLARLDAPADWPRIDARALTETSVAAWLGASPNVAEPVVRN